MLWKDPHGDMGGRGCRTHPRASPRSGSSLPAPSLELGGGPWSSSTHPCPPPRKEPCLGQKHPAAHPGGHCPLPPPHRGRPNPAGPPPTSPSPRASCAQAVAARKSTNHLLPRASITPEEEEEGQPPLKAFTPGPRSVAADLPMGGWVGPPARPLAPS